jgi:hypothetical protein
MVWFVLWASVLNSHVAANDLPSGLRDLRQKCGGLFASDDTSLSNVPILGLRNSKILRLGEVFLSGAWHSAGTGLQKRI